MAASGGGTVQQTGEPSVDDILRSIRKVVGGNGPARSSAGDSQAGGESGEGVLELTDVFEHPQAADQDRDRASEDEGDAGEEQPMLPPERRAAIRESLNALAALAAPGVAQQLERSAESSLDSLTRELLRPMMAEWLDRNLPPLVEKLLRAEVSRIVGRSA